MKTILQFLFIVASLTTERSVAGKVRSLVSPQCLTCFLLLLMEKVDVVPRATPLPSSRLLQSEVTAACREATSRLIQFTATVTAASFEFISLDEDESAEFGRRLDELLGDEAAIVIVEEVNSNPIDPNDLLNPAVASGFLFSISTKLFEMILDEGTIFEKAARLVGLLFDFRDSIEVFELVDILLDSDRSLFDLLSIETALTELDDLLGLVRAVRDVQTDCSDNPPESGGTEIVDVIFDLLEAACFSSHNTVDVQGKGRIGIEKLQIGDYVKTSANVYSRVYFFGHKDHDSKIDYVEIEYTGGTSKLEISSFHMLFVEGRATPAKDVKVGDRLGENQTVLKVKSVRRRGLFAPMTENGEVMVSDVRASSYVSLLPNIDPTFQVKFYHAVLAPLRAACRMNAPFCHRDDYTIHDFALSVSGYSVSMQWCFLIVATPVAWILAQLEYVSSALILAVAAWMIARRVNQKSGMLKGKVE